MNIREALISGIKFLSPYTKLAGLEARLLLSRTLAFTTSELIKHDSENITAELFTKYKTYLEQRAIGMPIAYIIGSKEFYGRDFEVSPSVLIPRADTETLIDAVLKNYKENASPVSILELGVGSGCVLITLLLEIKNTTGVGVDISEEALLVAKENANRYFSLLQGNNATITLFKSDWFKAITPMKYDIIISNPPYISKSEIKLLALETKTYEPPLALFAEGEGLDNYKIIASNAARFLKDNGRVYLEIGFRQKENIETIFTEKGFILESSYKDLAGYDRCIVFTKGK